MVALFKNDTMKQKHSKDQQELPNSGQPKQTKRPAAHTVAAVLVNARIGATIRAIRIAKGFKVGELAAEAGISASALSRGESGMTDLRASTIWALETALGVKNGWIFQTAG